MADELPWVAEAEATASEFLRMAEEIQAKMTDTPKQREPYYSLNTTLRLCRAVRVLWEACEWYGDWQNYVSRTTEMEHDDSIPIQGGTVTCTAVDREQHNKAFEAMCEVREMGKEPNP